MIVLVLNFDLWITCTVFFTKSSTTIATQLPYPSQRPKTLWNRLQWGGFLIPEKGPEVVWKPLAKKPHPKNTKKTSKPMKPTKRSHFKHLNHKSSRFWPTQLVLNRCLLEACHLRLWDLRAFPTTHLEKRDKPWVIFGVVCWKWNSAG